IAELNTVEVPRTAAPIPGNNDRVIDGGTDEPSSDNGEETAPETDETIYVPVRPADSETPTSEATNE
ncbi:MAG: hypothetical protein V3T05_09505, partial [Myxococcota bacterium]